jgi:hypothetical protein
MLQTCGEVTLKFASREEQRAGATLLLISQVGHISRQVMLNSNEPQTGWTGEDP